MTSLPRFSVQNPVLVNLLMIAIMGGGLVVSCTLVREMFPEFRPNEVMIGTVYPGATPKEVEKGISMRIEEEIKDVEGVDEIETRIGEGVSTIIVTLDHDVEDLDVAVNDFKAAIDAIPRDELPAEAEETRVFKFEPVIPVIAVSLYGHVPERLLKDAGQRLRDDLLRLPGLSDVRLRGVRKDELIVEVQPERLIKYGLSITEVSEAIRRSNLELPGGQIKTADERVAIRTLGETDEAEAIGQTVVRTGPSGEVIRVRDLGQVIDGFEETDMRGRFNGAPAVSIIVFKTADQDAIDIADSVKAFVAGKQGQPPRWDWLTRVKNVFGVQTEAQRVYEQARNDPSAAAVNVRTHNDLARFIEGRLELLTRNGLWGLSLVFLSLLLFLNWRVAFWVMMGLLIAVLGAVMVLGAVGETLNLITMFGLIVVLGLLVDDAIVIGENIYTRVEAGEDPRLAAVGGAEQVTWPVVVAVLTTIGAFLPLMFIEGRIGDFMGVLPVVVTCALGVSLIEALVILPSHLAEWLVPVHRRQRRTSPTGLLSGLAHRARDFQKRVLRDVIGRYYERLLRTSASYRYVTVAAVVAALCVTAGLIRGGRVAFVFSQKVDSDIVMADVEMPIGTPAEQTEDAIRTIESEVLRLSEVDNVFAIVGAQQNVSDTTFNSQSHLGQLVIELVHAEKRDRSSEQIVTELRHRCAAVPGINKLKFSAVHGGPSGVEIEIQVTGEKMDHILAVAEDLKAALGTFRGVYDITDDYDAGRRELQIELLDSARPLGLTTETLATQVRGAFYGLEARTLQRDREDVDIRVRFPEDRRVMVHELEQMRVATPDGHLVPFCEVARLTDTQGYTSIRRVDQRRAVVVSADVDHSEGNTAEIVAALAAPCAELEQRYPGVRISFEGSRREYLKSFGSLKRDFLIALGLIFVMLAALFRSYVQPLVVMSAIPFALVGAVLGHLVMGYPLTILSMIGLVALTGIVVNDSLILVDFVNRERRSGSAAFEAVISGGKRRLRPILLTSLTTILGLAPLMAEQSFQARFLIPMAISITFGLAFATLLTLVVVPSLYLIVLDFQRIGGRVWHGPAARRPQDSLLAPLRV